MLLLLLLLFISRCRLPGARATFSLGVFFTLVVHMCHKPLIDKTCFSKSFLRSFWSTLLAFGPFLQARAKKTHLLIAKLRVAQRSGSEAEIEAVVAELTVLRRQTFRFHPKRGGGGGGGDGAKASSGSCGSEPSAGDSDRDVVANRRGVWFGMNERGKDVIVFVAIFITFILYLHHI